MGPSGSRAPEPGRREQREWGWLGLCLQALGLLAQGLVICDVCSEGLSQS